METARIRLRSLGLADACAVSELMTPGVSRWLTNFPVPLTQGQAEQRIKRILSAEAAAKACVLAFEQKNSSEFMGWFAVYVDQENSCGVLGYWLGEAFQRLGLMSEGALLALSLAKDRLRVERIEAYIHPDNKGSLSIASALGLAVSGSKLVYASARDREELCLHLTTDQPVFE